MEIVEWTEGKRSRFNWTIMGLIEYSENVLYLIIVSNIMKKKFWPEGGIHKIRQNYKWKEPKRLQSFYKAPP